MGTVTQFVGYCIFAASMLFSGGTLAAQFTPAPRDGCFASLSGPIVEGDAANFRAVIERHWTGDYKELVDDNRDQALCLDSPGGSFLEAIEIAKAVNDEGIATKIGAGEECLSACALIFMAGRISGPESDAVHRFLHVEGTLGFHAPYLALDADAMVSGQAVNAYVPEHNRILSEFVRLASYRTMYSYKSSFSMGLFIEMLATPPDELFLIDTVEKAARWSIQLDGERQSASLTKTDRVQACENQLSWLYDEESRSVQSENIQVLDRKAVKVQNWFDELVEMDKISILSGPPKDCFIGVSAEGGYYFPFCLYDENTGLQVGNCENGAEVYPDYFPWWHAMPPDMPLRALR